MNIEFKREERYLVFKLSDVEEHFTPGEKQQLARLVEVQRVGREEAGKAPLECVVVESDWPEYEPTWRAIEARVTGAQPAPSFADAYQGAMEDVAIWKKRALEAEDLNRKFIAGINSPMHMGEPAQPAQKAVAYLDLGVGGYMDIGTDLTDEALATIPKGRHMLGIVGTYGVEGYSPAQPAPSDEYVGWYCAHCERGVDASEVTYHEQHEVCGRVITDDRPPKPAPTVPTGWLRAIDEALVAAHIGVVNAGDTYEQAKAKLVSLIGFHTDVATDPATNGGWKLMPVEPTEEVYQCFSAYDGTSYSNPFDRDEFLKDWRAALAASPEAKS